MKKKHFFVLLFCSAIPFKSFSQGEPEKLVKMTIADVPGTDVPAFNIHIPASKTYANSFNTGTPGATLENSVFSVYTTDQVNKIITDASTKTLNAVDSKIEKTEKDLNAQMITSINNIPQRILNEEAKKIIVDAVLIQLRAEIDILKRDLQSQINDLKNKIAVK